MGNSPKDFAMFFLIRFVAIWNENIEVWKLTISHTNEIHSRRNVVMGITATWLLAAIPSILQQMAGCERTFGTISIPYIFCWSKNSDVFLLKNADVCYGGLVVQNIYLVSVCLTLPVDVQHFY